MQKLSHSAREMFETCGFKYELHYEKRYRSILTSSALIFGSSLDLALNELLLNRDLQKAKDIFLEDFLKHEHNFNIVYYKSDLAISLLDSDLMWDIAGIPDKNKRSHYEHFFSLEAKGLKMLEAYAKDILPRIKNVIAIQKDFSIEYPEQKGVVRGVIDLIADIELEDGSVVSAILDNKSASAPYAKNSVKTKEQTALYHLAYPEYAHVGFLVINKKDFSTQVIVGEVPKELVESTSDKFKEAFNKIEKRKFAKNKKSCYAFGQACPFLSFCNGKGFSSDIYEKVDG
jgi:hypothetical protein